MITLFSGDITEHGWVYKLLDYSFNSHNLVWTDLLMLAILVWIIHYVAC